MTDNRKRRIARFSLQTLLITMTVLAVWLCFHANRAHHQRRAVRWLRQKNASFYYDWQFKERADGVKLLIGKADNRPPGPIWLRRQIGDEYFQRVIGIDASIDDVTLIVGLPGLESLAIRNSTLQDIRPLASLTSLKRLSLSNTQVSDVSPLAKMTKLEGLYLIASPISDLSAIANLHELEELSISGSSATDLSPLVDLPKLRILHVDAKQVGDISVLSKLPITDLRVHDFSFSDEQLRELRQALPDFRVSR